jgi:hypothetical protein
MGLYGNCSYEKYIDLLQVQLQCMHVAQFIEEEKILTKDIH